MKRLLSMSLAITALVVACGPVSDQVETSASPTHLQDESSPPTEIDHDTAANATPAPPFEGMIEPGLYPIGMEEGQLAPGRYFGSGPECAWERLSGLGGTMNEVIANAGPVPRFYVEILEPDAAFRLKWCSMSPLEEVPAPSEISLPIGPGVYMVGRDIDPGLYQGNGESCTWGRLSGLGGTYEEVIDFDRTEGQFYVDIQETDMAFSLEGCSIMPVSQILAPSEFLTHLEPGMYLVGRDIEAGLYQGVSEGSCYWQRRSNFAGGREGLIADEAPEGPFQVRIEATDFLFRISWCAVDRVE